MGYTDNRGIVHPEVTIDEQGFLRVEGEAQTCPYRQQTTGCNLNCALFRSRVSYSQQNIRSMAIELHCTTPTLVFEDVEDWQGNGW